MQPLSYERKDILYFITLRTLGSRLWLVNNRGLEQDILGYLAKYQKIYRVRLYGFIFMGNHLHLLASFPRGNRARFMRSFGAIGAKAVISRVRGHGQQKVWGRRYAFQGVLGDSAAMERYCYLANNPISSGLCSRLSEYSCYNSYNDQQAGRTRKYKVVDYKRFHDKLRWDPDADVKDFTREYRLVFSRLPGCRGMSKRDYQKFLYEAVSESGEAARQSRKAAGRGFGNRRLLLQTTPGDVPRHTKRSNRTSFRPLVFCHDLKLKKRFLSWYFSLIEEFREASRRYLSGEDNVIFPSGTYPPSRVCIV